MRFLGKIKSSWYSSFILTAICCISTVIASLSGISPALAQPGKQIVYSNGLEFGWVDWSWDATIDLEDRDKIHGGLRAIKVRYDAAWAGLRLQSLVPLNGADYRALQFRIHGGVAGGQQVKVVLFDASAKVIASRSFVTPAAGRWLSFEIPMRDLGAPQTFTAIAWQDSRGTPQPEFYLDDIILITVSGNPPPAVAANPTRSMPTPTSRPPAQPPTATPRRVTLLPTPTQVIPTRVAVLPTDIPPTRTPTIPPRRVTLLPTPTSRPVAAVPTRVPIDGPRLVVDARARRVPISPYIYGMNWPDRSLADELRLPVGRWGGNATTRYNWKLDTTNRAKDYFFENIPNDNANPGQLPDGSASDEFVKQNLETGTKSLITLPMIGWTAKSRDFACGFSVAKYGAQQHVEPFRGRCGNGIRPDGSLITGNDPTDTSIPIDEMFVQAWMRHLIAKYGTAAEGGVMFYGLDNEPMLWHLTHRDVHPEPLGYDGLRDLAYRYAAAIKAVDPGAMTLGPSEWGWTNYFYSARDLDAESRAPKNPRDRAAHGNVPLAAWYLQQMRAYERQTGVRILDYFDLHFYPQAEGVALHEAGDAETQALRLRSTRALWDPRYRDESWIGDAVQLIPRMRQWINQHYPGTRLAISEYNWGGLEHINGALAQADILGIFGREQVDLAALWGPPDPDQPGAFAFRMYLNYDGKGSQFGDTSVSATSADQGRLAIYASTRTTPDGPDSALLLMIINKTDKPLTSEVIFRNFKAADRAEVYRYSRANLTDIVRQPNHPVDPVSGSFVATFPRESITLMVIRAAG